jgi:hypothetical protein
VVPSQASGAVRRLVLSDGQARSVSVLSYCIALEHARVVGPSDARTTVARPEPGDAWKLAAKIEEFASDLCRRGVSEEKALRDAAFAVFEAAPDSCRTGLLRLRVAGGRGYGTSQAGRSAVIQQALASKSPTSVRTGGRASESKVVRVVLSAPHEATCAANGPSRFCLGGGRNRRARL